MTGAQHTTEKEEMKWKAAGEKKKAEAKKGKGRLGKMGKKEMNNR